MKQYAVLLTLSLMTLAGCWKGKEKERIEETRETTEAPEHIFVHVEAPTDTTLPQPERQAPVDGSSQPLPAA